MTMEKGPGGYPMLDEMFICYCALLLGDVSLTSPALLQGRPLIDCSGSLLHLLPIGGSYAQLAIAWGRRSPLMSVPSLLLKF